MLSAEYTTAKQEVALKRTSLADRAFLQCGIVCIEAALEAIRMICNDHACLRGGIGYLDAWWYNVLYIYTSSTVLIAARLSPSIMEEVSEASIRAAWRLAVAKLEEYSSLSKTIYTLVATLKLLWDAVPQQYLRSRRAKQGDPGPTAPSQAPTTFDPGFIHMCTHDPTSLMQMDDAPSMTATSLVNTDLSSFLDFDALDFDPSDLSWLTTIPMNS